MGPPLTLALVNSPWSAALASADAAGDLERLNIRFRRYDTGRACLDALLAGEVDLATCTDIPIVDALGSGQRLRLIATLATDSQTLSLISDSQHGVATLTDLVGKRIGLPPRTNAAFYLTSLLQVNGLSIDQFEIVDIEAAASGAALIAGKVAAVCIWSPHRDKILAELGDRAVSFDDRLAYNSTWNLLTRPADATAVTDQRLVVLLRLLIDHSALLEQEDSQTAMARAAAFCELDPETMQRHLDTATLSPRLDQALLLLLERQARWRKLSIAPESLLTTLDPSILQRIDPGRCTLIE